MFITEKPLFMQKQEWYHILEEDDKLKLTEVGKSIPEVRKSYIDHYAKLGSGWLADDEERKELADEIRKELELELAN